MQLSRLFVYVLLPLAFVAQAFADECDPNDPTLLKPDLVAMTPARVRVLQRGADRKIIFTTTIANVGKGPLVMQGSTVQTASGPVTQATQVISRTDGTTCTHVAGFFEFHQTHNHWHINDFASYELRKDDPFTGPIAAKSDKVSFCLIDITQLRGFNGPRQVFANCTSQNSTQGISVGFADVYDNFLPEQWIDLDQDPANPVPAGSYFLVNVADPDDLIMETDDSPEDSSGIVSVSVPPLVGSRSPRPPRPPHPPHPHTTGPGHPTGPRH